MPGENETVQIVTRENVLGFCTCCGLVYVYGWADAFCQGCGGELTWPEPTSPPAAEECHHVGD